MADTSSLYAQLGGYDAIAAVARELVSRLRRDEQLGRFWAHRGTDGIERELQLLINFLCSAAGGPMLYTGRDMKVSHAGMRISEQDWTIFIGHLQATLDSFQVPAALQQAVVGFVQSTGTDIVEPLSAIASA